MTPTIKRRPGRPRKAQPEAPAALPAGPYLDATGDVLPSGIALITALAAIGAPQRKIAAELGLTIKKFKAMLGRADESVRLSYERGLAHVENEVAQMLLAAGRKGHVIAAIYYSKSQLGWAEQQPPDQRPNVTIVLPDALQPDAYIRTINEPQKVTRQVNRRDLLPAPEGEHQP
jgi:hypothetical protein